MVVQARFRIPVEAEFDLRLTLFGHGWIDLAPFSWSAEAAAMDVVVGIGQQAVDLRVTHRGKGLSVTVGSARALSGAGSTALRRLVPRMLRLDEDLGPFWRLCAGSPGLAWVAERRAGRMLRGASAFEDLMKLLFTTNCSWAATRLMTSRLVAALGPVAPSGQQAFPSPQACADVDENFYRTVVRAGYRAGSCCKLARAFAAGELDENRFCAPGLELEEVRRRLLALPGFGPYAAGQAMRLFGHYKDLALDSWCRARFAERAGRGGPPSDREVAKRYSAFDPYDGLALWMDLTSDWHPD